MLQVVYAQNKFNNKYTNEKENRKKMANMLFKKEMEKVHAIESTDSIIPTPTPHVPVKKEKIETAPETISNIEIVGKAQESKTVASVKDKIIFADVDLTKSSSKNEITSLKIWDNSIELLSTYIHSISQHYPIATERMGDEHMEILKFLLVSKEFLLDYLLKDELKQEPYVSIDKSIERDHIICLEDGKKTKLLGLYIKNKYNMTKKEYLIKWNLPHNYPFVAPSLSQKRKIVINKVWKDKREN